MISRCIHISEDFTKKSSCEVDLLLEDGSKRAIMRDISLAIAAIVCAVIFCLADDASRSHPPLYLATRGGESIFLFGTLHSGVEQMYPMSRKVEAALAICGAISTEIDDSPQNLARPEIIAMGQELYEKHVKYADDAQIFDHIDAETLTIFPIRLHISAGAFAFTHPLDLARSTPSPGAIEMSEDLGVERYLLDCAYSTGRPVFEAEGFKAQFEIYSKVPDKVVEHTIVMRFMGDWSSDREIVRAWIAGDEEELARQTDLTKPSLLKKWYRLGPVRADEVKRYEDAMYYDRNKNFADRAEELAASPSASKDGRPVFMAIGFMHLYGSGSVIEILRDRGWHVREVGRSIF